MIFAMQKVCKADGELVGAKIFSYSFVKKTEVQQVKNTVEPPGGLFCFTEPHNFTGILFFFVVFLLGVNIPNSGFIPGTVFYTSYRLHCGKHGMIHIIVAVHSVTSYAV